MPEPLPDRTLCFVVMSLPKTLYRLAVSMRTKACTVEEIFLKRFENNVKLARLDTDDITYRKRNSLNVNLRNAWCRWSQRNG